MLSRYSVKRAYTVLVGVVLILILGVVSFTSMKTDLLPDMTLPYAIVYTTYPGASPEEVETMVTRPVEQAMATISNIETVNSVSGENVSTVILEFSQSANMDAATIEMREKLDQIEGYWDDSVGSPVIMKLNPDMLPVMVSALEAGEMTQSDLTDLVNNEILPELESIEGVASVSASGTIEEQVQVMIREDKLEAVNRKIRQALDEQFEEAESEIEEGQAELENGKQQLENGQNQLADQTSAAESQISAGTGQIITGQIQIDQKLSEVEAGLTKLDDSEKELEEKEKELVDAELALSQLPTQQATLEAQKTQLESAISLLEQAPGALEELDRNILWMETVIDVLKAMDQTEKPSETETKETGNVSQTETGISSGGSIPSIPSSGGNVSSSGVEESSVIQEDALEPYEAPVMEIEVQQPETAALVETPVIDTQAGNIPTAEDISRMLEGVSISAKIKELETTLAECKKQRSQILDGLSSAGVDVKKEGSALIENIDSVKTQLISRKLQLEDGLTQIQEAIDKMPEQQAAIASGRQAITDGKAQISEGRTQLLEAKEQLLAAKQKISSGQSTAAEATAQLNQAKIAATIEMAVGKAELNQGQKQLDEALEQIRSQKETAYDQADVTQIVTADMVKGILAAQNFTMPAGYVTEEGVDFLVRIGNKLETTEDLENLMLLDLHMDGLDPIRLSDVADVQILDNSAEIYAKINGNAGVMFTMQKQSGYSTGEVSNRIKKKFSELEESGEGIHFIRLMDQGIYIDMVVDSVLQNMLSGAALAILILLIFLKSFRTTLVIAVSIPISILTAVVLMYFSNISLNIISLSGLALGIGMLVDNSIVVIENIFRLRNEGYGVKKAAVEGANQVAGSIAASTLTTVCVFLPIVFTEGITRQLFVDMGLTIGYSLAASLLVALTVVPAMGAGLLKKKKERPDRFFTFIQNGYGAILRVSLKVKFLVLLLAAGLLVISMKLSLSKGTAFMPEMESTQVTVNLQMPKDSTLAETAAMSDTIIERIRTLTDVTDVGAMAGGSGMGSMMGGSGGGTDQVSMYVLLTEEPELSNEELVKEIQEKTADLNCTLDIETSTMDMSALGGSGISINIKGRELDQLKKMAGEVAAIVGQVEGTKNVSDGIAEKTLELRLVVDKDKAMEYQLTTAQVFQFLAGKLAEASSATTLSTLSRDYSVLVVSDTDETLTRDKIRELTIKGTDKDQNEVDVPLKDLVEFVDTEGFSSINRQAQTRYVTVSAEIEEGHNIGLVAAEVEKALNEYEVPKGYSLEMAGEDETINEAMVQMLKMLAMAVAFMYLIMVAQFQSLLSPFIIMFTIPLAFTGGFFGLYLTGSPVSIIAMLGFVMLSGIIVNNGIVLVDYINQLRRSGMEKRDAIVEAGRTRLRPIIMTALTTILGLIMMAVGGDMGADMVQPMAIVTIGGLTYGTLLTLFVVPCIYDILNRKKDMTEEDL